MLAYSIDDDKWGTRRSVDAAYPIVERGHVTPSSIGVARIGHFGAFRPEARALWEQTAAWMAAITAS